MKKFTTIAATAGLILGASLLSTSAIAVEKQFVSIGTGGVTGVYHPTGGAI